MKTILLTGANGFIATYIARNLLAEKDVAVLALVRAKDTASAKVKLEREWWDHPELVQALGTRIQAVAGDICNPNIGLTEENYLGLVEKTTHIIHTAADWRFRPLIELRKTNVQGTANLIALAKKINQHHQLERFSYISTAYVAGAATGTIMEDQLTDKHGFLTNYEQSKYEAEQLVHAAKEQLCVSVFRPSMVVGDSKTGAIKTFNTFYFPLRLYLTGKMRFMPVSRSLRVNIVPVDYVANAVTQLTFNPKAEGKTFHTVAPHETLPQLGELLDFVRKWANTEIPCKLPTPICIPLSASQMKTALKLQRAFSGQRKVLDTLISLSPYFSENRKLDRSNIDKFLGPYDFKWKDIMPNLLSYAVYNSFFHRSDRTVYEQILFRLESQSHPVRYYDLVEGKIIKKTAQEMRRDICALTAAMTKYGIRAGDRVALTGLNSTRYLAVDVAIGLVGAVSVPLYYTAPPQDINDVLSASGAKLFFVGMPSLLNHADELKPEVPLVSICRVNPHANSQRKIIPWDQFLSKDYPAPTRAPVSFGDIATLRYSSGTTGKPKGAIFTHANLRYMGESTASITPWMTRNQPCSYLSFLPMGHVVEGILALYCPYYLPTAVDVYFLEDFRKLQEMLPKVRPIIFFAVPRLYEKIWAALEKNSLGRFYVKTKNPLLKSVLRSTLRRVTLKKAGLDKCDQLIAGSANFSVELLKKYRNIGIEVHNAYGLTEAPLVTLNRFRKNRIETVGEPMPFTEVKVSEDGEIMVRGPQVTPGYFDKFLEQPFKEGYLMTGDIGVLTDEGSLIIYGRKKEIIKTSYGKCVYTAKIEGMLRELPKVTESLLLGESKPYCTALLWVESKNYKPSVLSKIDEAMNEVNKQLSNPEKIKRWAVLPNNLSIENGELTPNLKLKRNVTAVKNQKIIDALYNPDVSERGGQGLAYFGSSQVDDSATFMG